MNNPIRILGIAGSLRRESYNRAALLAATALVPEGAILETFELNDIPIFNQDEDQQPPDVDRIFQVKRRHEFCQIIGVCVHVVAIPRLARTPVPASVVRNAAIAV